MKWHLAGTLGALAIVAGQAHALTFNLTDGAGLISLQGSNPALYTQVRQGFVDAAALWSARLSDNVTINITIDYSALGAGVLGSTSNTSSLVSYANTRTALTSDISSALDTTAVSNLQSGTSLRYITNDTATAGRPRVDDNDASVNNRFLSMTKANAKALGLTTDANNNPINYATSDASITFSSNFAFDFDRSNGINGAQFDFIGIAAHEIGHSLGFVSGVDTVDGVGTGTDLDPFVVFTTADLFRYSGTADTNIAGFGRVMDLAHGGTPFFSVDRGATNLGNFSTGRNFGDGQQASHWKDNLGIGIMDPTAANGELINISAADLRLFDAIGWNLVAVPEPGTFALLGLGLVGGFWVRRRK